MSKKFSEKKIDEAIYKKAVGYEANEVVEEFALDEKGEYKLNQTVLCVIDKVENEFVYAHVLSCLNEKIGL